MIKTFLAAGAMAALASTSSWAEAPKGVSLSQDKKTVTLAPHAAMKSTPNYERHPASTIIYSNLASKYPKGTYFEDSGWTLCGPSCAVGESISVGGTFTPSANVTAARVEAAVGYIEGTSTFTLAIYSDSNGVPGTELWSGVAKTLPEFGTCCALAKVTIKGGLALTGGTPYWVVAEADKKESTTFAAWNQATTDQIDSAPLAFNDAGAGWEASTTNLPPAFAVYSK